MHQHEKMNLRAAKGDVGILISYANKVKEHTHLRLELAYIKSGWMEHQIHGESRFLGPGDYFIVDHGVSHSYRRISQERLVVLNFIFKPVFLDQGLVGSQSFQDVMSSYLLRFCYRSTEADPTGQTFHDEDGQVGALLERAAEEFSSESYGYIELLRSILVEILILTMRKLGGKKTLSAKSDVVNQMIRHVSANYREQVRLNALAEELGYNPSYLSQKFIQETGISFMEYLHRVRVDRSCHLLQTTDMRVSRIAAEVGYEDIKYFNKIFKQHLAVTPREFRAACK